MKGFEFGTQFKTNFNGVCTVISYVNNKNVLVMFEDGTLVKCRSGNLKNGVVNNPNRPSVFGVGICDVKGVKCNQNKKYQLWYSVLRRAYSDVYHKDKPTYKDVEVCERWKRFSSFSEDVEKIPFFEKSISDNYELDKDILVRGNRMYSPDTCCFVPRQINAVFGVKRKPDSDLPTGVAFNNKLKKYVCSVCQEGVKSQHIGVFKTSEEARAAYVEFKLKRLRGLAEQYKGQIDQRVYDALMNWNFE